MKKIITVIFCLSLFCLSIFVGCTDLLKLAWNYSPKLPLVERLGNALSLDFSDAIILDEAESEGWDGAGEYCLQLKVKDGFEEHLKLWEQGSLVKGEYQSEYLDNCIWTLQPYIPEIENAYWLRYVYGMRFEKYEYDSHSAFVVLDIDADIIYYQEQYTRRLKKQ